jgi:hypothetical protein
MNQTIKPSSEKAEKIIQEVIEKVNDYEGRMSSRLTRWVEIAELYSGKTATQKENSKLSPNSAELYKAIRAMRNMIMRMLLGQKPCFELECLDIIGYDDPYKLLKTEHYITNQLDLARFDKGMARALDQLLLYGTVAIHEQYEPLRASFLGRKNYVTTFRPVSLINCAFSLDTYDIEESSWVALSDIQSNCELEKLLRHDPDGKVYDHGKIKGLQGEPEYSPQVNNWVKQRMAWQGYVDGDFKGGMERTTYYGPLDCMPGNEEYAIEIVNRKAIIRMEACEGIRPVRIATINTIDVEPLGNGLGDMFAPMLGKIDDTESALLNMITLAGANMFAKQKSLTDEDMEFVVRQFGIMNLENPDLRNIGPDPRSIAATAGYSSDAVQKFRQAAGAPDTLQAILSSEQHTATAVSLAMNESVRNLSVQAQLLSPVLVQDHIKVVLQNAQKYNTAPFVLNIGGAPVTVVPSDLMIDVNVRVKTSTDQDFRPTKLQRLREGMQAMAIFGADAIPGKRLNPGPALLEYFKTLDVPNWNESIQDLTPEDMLNMRMAAEMRGGPAQEGRAMPPEVTEGEGTMTTPVGEVLAPPGEEAATTSAIRRSTVGAYE